NALKPEEIPIRITGSEKCNTCHSLKALGNQQKSWDESAHSKAYNTLLSDKAKIFNKEKGLETPEQNKLCIRCHTTKGILITTDADVTYNVAEGVGCEACHGAGSDYSPAEIMKEEELFIKHGGVVGNEETCLKCHSQNAWNKSEQISESVCPFQDKDFNYKTSFEKIKHPLNKENIK
ncbi:MAG TPA: multiheme c-type cytochrome, partial [Ignavibacteria bacterium]